MRPSAIAVSAGVLAASAVAHGQASLERFERTLDQIQRETRLLVNPDVPVSQRTLIDYGGYLSFGFFAVDDVEQHTHILRQYDLVGYGRASIDGVHDFFVRGRASYQDFNSGDSFDDDGDEAEFTLEQAFYRFDLARARQAYHGARPDYNLVFQGGRQFVYWANGLVLGQTIDGVTLEASCGNLTAQLLAGMTARDDVIDFDSSRPDFDEDTLRAFYGAMVSAKLGRHRPFAYFLAQRDHNKDDEWSFGGLDTEYEYNSWYIGVGANGSFGDRLLYAVELVYEGGDGLSNSFDPSTFTATRQTEDDIEAMALDVRLEYLLADAHRTRLTLETIIATGDDDRLRTSTTFGGNRPGSTDRAFNAWGVINTGLAFAPSVSNLTALRVGASTYPFGGSGAWRNFQVGADLFAFGKFDEDAPIDELTTPDWFLGFEPDVYLNWRITSDLTFALRYGIFFPGEAIVSDEHARHFLFAGMTFSF